MPFLFHSMGMVKQLLCKDMPLVLRKETLGCPEYAFCRGSRGGNTILTVRCHAIPPQVLVERETPCTLRPFPPLWPKAPWGWLDISAKGPPLGPRPRGGGIRRAIPCFAYNSGVLFLRPVLSISYSAINFLLLANYRAFFRGVQPTPPFFNWSRRRDPPVPGVDAWPCLTLPKKYDDHLSRKYHAAH